MRDGEGGVGQPRRQFKNGVANHNPPYASPRRVLDDGAGRRVEMETVNIGRMRFPRYAVAEVRTINKWAFRQALI
jgi:hypothetical protein